VLVPFFCDVFVGKPLRWSGDKTGFMSSLESAIKSLADEGTGRHGIRMELSTGDCFHNR
jgi:hypothetical protein